jgi:hypothetical protein
MLWLRLTLLLFFFFFQNCALIFVCLDVRYLMGVACLSAAPVPDYAGARLHLERALEMMDNLRETGSATRDMEDDNGGGGNAAALLVGEDGVFVYEEQYQLVKEHLRLLEVAEAAAAAAGGADGAAQPVDEEWSEDEGAAMEEE